MRLDEICGSELVITNRIHVALPCLAMGVPVIFLHESPNADPRLASFLRFFWHKTGAAECLPDVESWREIKNQTHFLEMRRTISSKFASVFSVPKANADSVPMI